MDLDLTPVGVFFLYISLILRLNDSKWGLCQQTHFVPKVGEPCPTAKIEKKAWTMFQNFFIDNGGHIRIKSRFVRHSTMTDMYINITVAKHEVRFISINDNFDIIAPNRVDNGFAGIKNWFNGFYDRDTSRKIWAVNKARGECREPLTVHDGRKRKKRFSTPRYINVVRGKIHPVQNLQTRAIGTRTR